MICVCLNLKLTRGHFELSHSLLYTLGYSWRSKVVLFPVLGICLPTAPHCDLIGHQASRVSVKSVSSRQGAADPDPTREADRLVFPACSSRRVAVSRLALIHTVPGVPPDAPMLIPEGMSSFFPSPSYLLYRHHHRCRRLFGFIALSALGNVGWPTSPSPPPTSPQQMKQAFAPAGQVPRSNNAEPHVFYEPCRGTRGGRTLIEATGGCGNVCRNARGYLTLKSNTCKMRNFSCREKINIIDPWGGIGDVSAGERWMVRPGVERQAVIKNLKANS